MTRVSVVKDDMGDWVMGCALHETTIICPDWEVAYEAALGHHAMHHPLRAVILRDYPVAPDILNAASACYLDAAAFTVGEYVRRTEGRDRHTRDVDFLVWIADEIERQSRRWARPPQAPAKEVARLKTITTADVKRCPIHSPYFSHYNGDGTCQCVKPLRDDDPVPTDDEED